jgi:hypothetical protein
MLVEGQTEETFVRDILAPVLGESLVFADVHRITTGRKGPKVYRGGHLKYEHLRRDLTIWMKEDQRPDAWFTTMVDLYGLPADVPGYDESRLISDPIQKAQFLQNELKSDLGHWRFLPYVQLHEFEALLFSDPDSFFAAFPDEVDAVAAITRIRRTVTSPEHIDDGADTAPSRRICDLFPQYTKTVHGPIIARRIGLPKMRQECAHFNAWLEAILAL